MRIQSILFAGAVIATTLLLACQKNPDSVGSPPAASIHGQAIQSSPAPAANSIAPAVTATPAATALTAAAPIPAPVVTEVVPKPAELVGEFMRIGFDKLASFNYEMPDESPATMTNKVSAPVKEQIPTTVKSLDQHKIALKGFMLPLKVEGGLVTELLIMRDQSMCCYGTTPKITEWVSVKMTSKGVKPVMDQPVTIFGKLQVGEIRENGYLVGIYQMDGEKMSDPADL
jgi:hypothetical protein